MAGQKIEKSVNNTIRTKMMSKKYSNGPKRLNGPFFIFQLLVLFVINLL